MMMPTSLITLWIMWLRISKESAMTRFGERYLYTDGETMKAVTNDLSNQKKISDQDIFLNKRIIYLLGGGFIAR